MVLTRLAAVASSSTTCPGGHWFDRGPDDPTGYPYDVFKVEAGAPKNSTGGLYSQVWTLRLAAYAPIGDLGASSVQATQQLFNNAFVSTAAITALRAISLRNASEKIVSAKIAAGRGEYAPTLREGHDVFLSGLTVEILVQGDKDQT